MPLSARQDRELKTISVMVQIYCRKHHNSAAIQANALCEDCSNFLEYARQRLAHCPFAEQKPTCGNCTIHCYKKDMQAKAKQIMRYSGPRMLWSHPIMALYHLLDSRKKSPAPSPCRQKEKK